SNLQLLTLTFSSSFLQKKTDSLEYYELNNTFVRKLFIL
ncbi:MAG: hypothetical protein ACJAVF_004923, partial [Paraglaciecola sp.]